MELLAHKIFDTLDYILPNVLNRIIIEYLTPVSHDFQLMGFLKNSTMYDARYCIDGNNVYMYDRYLLTISKKKQECDILKTSRSMCVYDNSIYVLDGHNIFIFDKKCKWITTISIPVISSDLIVVKNKIFTSFSHSKYITIIDVKNIEIPSSTFYRMKTNGEYVYVLTFDETIFKYTTDGEIIDTYICTDACIIDFCIIDDVVYAIDRNIGNIVTFKNGEMVCKDIFSRPTEMFGIECVNDTLYIDLSRGVYAYKKLIKPSFYYSLPLIR